MVTSSAGFVMAEENESGKRQEVLGIIPVKTYLVNFVDADGKKKNRLVFQPEGSDAVFNLQEKISGLHVATQASAWFKNSFNKKLDSKKEVESV